MCDTRDISNKTMKKIDLTQNLFNLKGEPFKNDEQPFTLGEFLASVLSIAPEGGKMKLYSLAKRAATEETIEVDSADLALLKQSVESAKGYNNVIAGQALEILDA